jgi:lysophospholipase L1-like esterase
VEPDDNPDWPDHNDFSFDGDNEGHGGWSIENLLDGLPTWLEDYTPDIVLLHAGTNNDTNGDGLGNALEALKQIIDTLREDNSNVITLLARLIPSSIPERNADIETINAEIYDIAGEKNAVSSPIVVVDQNTGFYASADTYDGIHPNASGEQKIAQKWFDAIYQAVTPDSCLTTESEALSLGTKGIFVAAEDDEDNEDNWEVSDDEDDEDDENDESNDEDNQDDESDSDDEDNQDDEDSTGRSQPIYILPLGDSITQANNNHRSYRYDLWVKLLDEGVNFDFVGSQNSNHNGNPNWSEYNGHSFDQDHEGHWGWRADELLASLPQWLQEYTPDIVLLHAGTNDAGNNNSTESTVSELKEIRVYQGLW